MILPQLPNRVQKKESQIFKLKGINLSDDYQDGSLRECINFSTRRYPYMATRRRRKELEGYENISSITSWNKLVAVRGTDLLYDGEVVGQVTEGEKQFAIVNTKLAIMPDKKYLDVSTKTLVDMASSVEPTGNFAFKAPKAKTDTSEAQDQYVQFSSQSTLNFTNYFKVGDGITISGCKNEHNNLVLTIKTVEAKKITFETMGVDSKNFVDATENGTIKFERKVPDFDFICEADNRVWGCVSSEQTIYASALGDPTNFYDYSGTSTCSYAVPVGSEGNFTGCHKLGSSVLFFKGNTLHKVVGDKPSTYAVYAYSIEGVKEGCHKSMQIINETLLYMSSNGVYAYSGGNTNYISSALGSQKYSNGVAGTDGSKYYLSCKDEQGKYNLFVYDLKNSIWMREDDTNAIDFTRNGDELYFLSDNGKIYSTDSLDEKALFEWALQFNPFYESTFYNGRMTSILSGKKKYSKVMIRGELPFGSHMVVITKEDDGIWKEQGRFYGSKTGLVTVVIALNRCDKFELRLEGKGQFTLIDLARIYSIGSERD